MLQEVVADVLTDGLIAVTMRLFSHILLRYLDEVIAGTLQQPDEYPDVWLHLLDNEDVRTRIEHLLLWLCWYLVSIQGVKETEESLCKSNMISLLLDLCCQREVVQDLGLLDLILKRLSRLRFQLRVEDQHNFELELAIVY